MLLLMLMPNYSSCYDLADEGSHAARNNDKLFKVIFKTDDPDTKRHVESNFEKLKEACSSHSREVSVTCRDPSEMCHFHGPLCMAHADRGNNQVVLCPFFFEQKARSQDVTANNQDTIILHELSHLLFGKLLLGNKKKNEEDQYDTTRLPTNILQTLMIGVTIGMESARECYPFKQCSAKTLCKY